MAKKPAVRRTKGAKKSKDRLAWWREARFGMFIHWGLYALPAGTWKGKRIPGIGEWIMHRAQIPVAEYEQLARKFNPVKFNADAWVKVAKDAGMKYIVITSKHHDGFAMFHSRVSKYNIVDATPYRRDPMKALARACKKAGIRLCFYHSQDFDWHHPGGAGNEWDYQPIADNRAGFRRRFAGYLRDKVRPQLREILTNYGPIGLIWFDCPAHVTRAQSMDLKNFVHKLQPKCLVNGRVGNNVGDYGSMGDNQIPAGRVEGDWETPATLNDTWGFKSYDHKWKSVGRLLYLLVDLASKGANYLLNVGPTAEGIIPKASVDRLKEIGKWMKVNGEAIYGTSPNPYPYELPWGRITQKSGKLYLLLFKWRRKLVLPGLRNKVKAAYLLRGGKKVQFSQTHDKAADHHAVELKLPARKPDKYISVVVLEIAGKTNVDESPPGSRPAR